MSQVLLELFRLGVYQVNTEKKKKMVKDRQETCKKGEKLYPPGDTPAWLF